MISWVDRVIPLSFNDFQSTAWMNQSDRLGVLWCRKKIGIFIFKGATTSHDPFTIALASRSHLESVI
jgi:hypothetical protein